MSAIDPASPADGAIVSDGDNKLREERVWLSALWTAWKVRHQDGAVANDPGTVTSIFKIPFSSPGTPRAGDIYFSTTGLLTVIRASTAMRLGGTLVATTKKSFRQNAAPTGWTRDASLTTGSGLRYVTGTPGSGGTEELTGPHSGNSFSFSYSGTDVDGIVSINNHTYKYLDVILATKD